MVLRHSKAATPFGVSDLQRPLNDRGRRDAAAAGVWLKAQGLRPDRVLCSPAVRTRQTLEGLGLDDGTDVGFERRIYDGTADDLCDLVALIEDHVGTLLLIGHNPSVHRLVFDLTGAVSDGFPTSALAVIDITADHAASWSDVRPGIGGLRTLWTP